MLYISRLMLSFVALPLRLRRALPLLVPKEKVPKESESRFSVCSADTAGLLLARR